MAVQKSKKSLSRKRLRRQGNSSIDAKSLHTDPKSGHIYKGHFMCLKSGTYNNKEVIKFVKKQQNS